MALPRKIPALLIDIDGVLIRGKLPLTHAVKTLKFLRSPLHTLFPSLNPSKHKFPFALLTNGGGTTITKKLEYLNSFLGLGQEELLRTENLILNYMPIKEDIHELKEKFIIMNGLEDADKIANYCGLSNFLSLKEFLRVNKAIKSKSFSQLNEKEAIFLENIGKGDDFDLERNIAAFILFDDVMDWEENLSSIIRLNELNPGFKVIAVHNDIVYPDIFPVARQCLGSFNEILLSLNEKISGKKLELIKYGKPSQKTFDFAKKFMNSHFANFPISNFYMIGDNPSTDIKGGNLVGMETILVRTGLFHDGLRDFFFKDELQRPKYIVENFTEAVKLIAEIEGFDFGEANY